MSKTYNRKSPYEKLNGRLKWFMSREKNWLASLSNASALLFQEMEGINWSGFYLFNGEELVLGPFQGKSACTRIKPENGVCGTAFSGSKSLVVPDVGKFPGHIACDSASRSEIVIPLRVDGEIVGVLDIDSPELERFNSEDLTGLEEFVLILMKNIEWNKKAFTKT